ALELGVYLNEMLAIQCIHGNNIYTLRRDRLLTEARIHLLIACAIRCRFPQLSVLSNHIFSKALGDYVRALRRDATCESTIRDYVQNTKIHQLPDLFLRAGYHSIRRSFAKRAD